MPDVLVDEALLTKENNYTYKVGGAKTKANEISLAVQNGGGAAIHFPWVKIGGKPDLKVPALYVSIPVAGDSSWTPLVRKLNAAGLKKFTIISGRHGDLPNIVNAGNETVGILEKEIFEQDEEMATAAEKELGVDILVVDSKGHTKNHTKWLREATELAFKSGRAVIFSWCYGIFTNFELGVNQFDGVPDAKDPVLKKVAGFLKKTDAAPLAVVVECMDRLDLDAAGKDKLAGGHKKACLELKELSKSFNWQAYKSRRMSEQEKTVANLVKDWFSWVK
ncbi:MAG TPA: hypothetical protein DCE44_19245 [Verrucomicrobiales bacterium]|nr:hypothetical protein [Verrucomicrobiales bacterium]